MTNKTQFEFYMRAILIVMIQICVINNECFQKIESSTANEKNMIDSTIKETALNSGYKQKTATFKTLKYKVSYRYKKMS